MAEILVFKVRSEFRKLSKMCKKWLINVIEEPGTRNATLDTETSRKQILFGFNLLLVFPEVERAKNALNSNQDLFQALSDIKGGECRIC